MATLIHSVAGLISVVNDSEKNKRGGGLFAHLGLEDLADHIHGEGDDVGQAVGGDKVGNGRLCELAIEDVLALVELFEENNGRSANTSI